MEVKLMKTLLYIGMSLFFIIGAVLFFMMGNQRSEAVQKENEDGDAKRRDEPAESHICRWLFLVHGG